MQVCSALGVFAFLKRLSSGFMVYGSWLDSLFSPVLCWCAFTVWSLLYITLLQGTSFCGFLFVRAPTAWTHQNRTCRSEDKYVSCFGCRCPSTVMNPSDTPSSGYKESTEILISHEQSHSFSIALPICHVVGTMGERWHLDSVLISYSEIWCLSLSFFRPPTFRFLWPASLLFFGCTFVSKCLAFFFPNCWELFMY